MDRIIKQWEQANDRRAIFLSCYAMMTQNMWAAVQAKAFKDPLWVNRLLLRFADYYFIALEAYENKDAAIPVVWQLAFQATCEPGVQPVQHLLLGVNAHINYDLTFALEDLLRAEWVRFSPDQQQLRYLDHCHVNDIIAQTVDAVQDDVLERYSPGMDIVDKLLGPIDEWAVVTLITNWRNQVWDNAIQLIEMVEQDEPHQNLSREVEQTAVQRARQFLRI